MTRRFGMEIEGRWHLFARSTVELQWPSAKSVPLRIFVADRSSGTEDLRFAVVQAPRKVRIFAEGLRGDQKFLKEIHAILKKAGARNVDALGFSDDSDIGTEFSMILEGPLLLPREWEQRIAPRPKTPPTFLDPDRIKIGQTVKGSALIRIIMTPGFEWTDRFTKVAEFRAIVASRRLRLNVFVGRDALRSLSWSTLQLVFKTRDDEATLKSLHDHAREVVAGAVAAFQNLGIQGTATLRTYSTPGIENAISLTWTGLDFRFSALERFAKSLGVNVIKLRQYRETINELLTTAREVCGASAEVAARSYLVHGAADPARVVLRLEELGWVRNTARSGNSREKGYQYFQQGSRKLTVNLGLSPTLISFETGWREPFAGCRNLPYVKG